MTLFAVVTIPSFAPGLNHNEEDMLRLQLYLQEVARVIGLFIAAAAGLTLLLKAIGGANLEQLSPFVFPLFAGLLLVNVDWTLAIPLGLIAFGFVVRIGLEVIGRPRSEAG